MDGKNDESYWEIAFFCPFFTLLSHLNPYSIEGSWWMINRIFRTSSCQNSQTTAYTRKNCLQLWRSPNETRVEKRWLSVILQREFGSLVPFSFMLFRSFLEVRWKLHFNPPFFWGFVLYEWNNFVVLQHEESKSRSKSLCTSVNYFAISSHLFTLRKWKLKLFAV